MFAGPGGWDEGLRLLGRDDVAGVEWDSAACATARAADHGRLQADVSLLDPRTALRRFGTVEGAILSPPCQGWSTAGSGNGRLDRDAVLQLCDRMAKGEDDVGFAHWNDPRSHLVAQPVRWVRELMPEFVALEQVPTVLSLWQHIAGIYREWGYYVWTGVLMASDYGVAQDRRRAFLLAHRSRRVAPPPRSHSGDGDDDLLGLPKRVSMAEALGWGMTERPYPTIASGRSTGVPDKEKVGGSHARATIYRERDAGRWLYTGTRSRATVRHADQPAPSLAFGHDVGSHVFMDRDVAPAEVAAAKASGEAVRLSLTEAATLQSFPVDYPWQGTATAKFRQIGDAVPPLLAVHVLAALGVGVVPEVLRRGGWRASKRRDWA